MSTHDTDTDADVAARVIERLLVDPAFRAEFRRDPALACREAGLDELAEQMSVGAGERMQTLGVRESRSSLAGVMMAAALEGVGVLAFVEHIAPAAAAVPGAVQNVLSRVNLPAIDPLRGSLAAPPTQPAAAQPAEDPADAAPVAPRAAAAAAPSAPAEPPPTADPPAEPATTADPATGSDDSAATTTSEEPATGEDSASDIERQQLPAQGDGAPAATAPVDPAQFGAKGTGGEPNAEALALLENKKVILDADGIADIKEGRIDPRVVAVLTKLSEKHTIQVSCMCRDHPELTTGGSVSNHHYGRGMDIAAVDGEPVNAGNIGARDVASELGSLDRDIQANEIGTPWQIADPRYFTDAGHSDHIHVAFDQPIDAGWKPPADVAAGGAAPAIAAATAGAGSTADAGIAGDAGTLQLAVAAKAAPSGDTLGIKIPTDAARAPSLARAAVGGAELVKDASLDGTGGPKAMAALKEALKYKGTPYKWGGSIPKTGFDCSGLVQYAYAQQGIQIPRVTDQQILASNGTEVKRGELRAGDLVFFRDPSGYVHHVGISMGGDKFLHAPHTGDVVKESSLKESYYAQQFAGGRRFDKASPDVLAAPEPAAVDAARAAHARDAVEATTPGTLTFKALSRQEASNHTSTLQFMRAIRPEEAPGFKRASAAAPLEPAGGPTGPLDYPGDDAPKSEIAAWMGRKAEAAGLPRELPVMASLVESGLTNIQGGDRDSVGFFQMRLGIWNKGKYAGYPDNPDLQLKWFIDTAVAVKEQRLARGEKGFLADTSKWGLWIADVERPQENLRFKYQLQFDRARELLGGRS